MQIILSINLVTGKLNICVSFRVYGSRVCPPETLIIVLNEETVYHCILLSHDAFFLNGRIRHN